MANHCSVSVVAMTRRGVRLKTLEIIVAENPWQPPFSFKDCDIAPITVVFEEIDLRAKLQKMRAKWDPNLKIWLIPYRLIRGTDLETRIPEEYLNGSKRL